MPASISSILFTEELLGDTPYGRRMSYRSVNAVTREDMIVFHRTYISPGNMYLSIVGDLTRAEAKSMLEAVLAQWKGKKVSLPQVAPLTEKADGTVYYVPKDAPQASVMIGHLGVKRNHPDEATIEVMNDIFGGGSFTARLMKEIRSNRGLTYGIYGGVFTGKDRGLFRISSQLKADKCVEALALVKDMIKDLQENPVTDEELELSKKSLANSFVFRFESKERLASEYMSLRLNGYPDDYFSTYLKTINKVTKEDVQAAARKFMDPSKMIVLVVGDAKKFDKPLSTLGTVKEIDYGKIAESDKSEK
jgi:predicted Zn-dependent peptidase